MKSAVTIAGPAHGCLQSEAVNILHSRVHYNCNVYVNGMRSEVLTPATLWDAKPCRLIEVDCRVCTKLHGVTYLRIMFMICYFQHGGDSYRGLVCVVTTREQLPTVLSNTHHFHLQGRNASDMCLGTFGVITHEYT
jgi:hypothetical protein